MISFKLNPKFLKREYLIRETLKSKYNKTPNDYIIMKINDLLFNKKSHYVSLFKEFLIFDDSSEFLTTLYKLETSIKFLQTPKKPQIMLPEYICSDINKIMQKNKNLHIDTINRLLSYKNRNIIKEYSNILNEENDTQRRIINCESKETIIDNINANNDITYSIDLRIDENYDYKNIDENLDFVEKAKNDDPFVTFKKYCIKKENQLINIKNTYCLDNDNKKKQKKRNFAKKNNCSGRKNEKLCFDNLFLKNSIYSNKKSTTTKPQKKKSKNLLLSMSKEINNIYQKKNTKNSNQSNIQTTTNTSTPKRNSPIPKNTIITETKKSFAETNLKKNNKLYILLQNSPKTTKNVVPQKKNMASFKNLKMNLCQKFGKTFNKNFKQTDSSMKRPSTNCRGKLNKKGDNLNNGGISTKTISKSHSKLLLK